LRFSKANKIAALRHVKSDNKEGSEKAAILIVREMAQTCCQHMLKQGGANVERANQVLQK